MCQSYITLTISALLIGEEVTFINEAQALSGKELTAAQALLLITSAAGIRLLLPGFS
jgi:hypothetical protein